MLSTVYNQLYQEIFSNIPANVSDVDLINQVENKNAMALNMLYDKYAPAVYGFIIRKVDTRSKANEILEQVFSQFWNEAQHNINGFEKLLLHLLKTANKLCIHSSPVTVRHNRFEHNYGSL